VGGRAAEQFHAWREHSSSGSIAGDTTPTPFRPPTMVGTRMSGFLMVAVRVALALWAVGLAVVTRRVRLADNADDAGQVDTMMLIGIGLGAAWLLIGALWSDQRTRNILRLEGHYPTRARAIRAWIFPAAWVALMSLTVLEVEPNPDFDWRPMLVVGGFVLTLWPPYQLIRRLFRSLLRVVPDAPILVLYALDLICFGLLWWWFLSWNDTDVANDSDKLGLLVSVAFATAMGLVVAAFVVWYIDRAADRAQVTRERTIRTRHDHRIARLQGLDPLDPATRWALYLARQAADRAPAGLAEPAPPPRPAPAPPKRSRRRSQEPTETEAPVAPANPSPAAAPVLDPDRVPIRALRRGTGPSTPAQQPAQPTGPAPAPAPLGEPAGASGIRRRLAAARVAGADELEGEWESGIPAGAVGRPLTVTEQLAERLGAELAAGGAGDFAATARQLSEHYAATVHDDLPAGLESVDASGEIPARVRTSRLLVMELLRYLALLVLLAGAMACAWLFLGVVDIESDAPDTVEPVERARRVAAYALAGSHVLMLGWLVAAACYGRAAGAHMSRLRLGGLCAVSVAFVAIGIAIDDFRFQAASALSLMIATLALVVGLRLFTAGQAALGEPTSATNVWIGVAAASALLVMLGPLRTPLSITTKSNELIFFAALCGLAMVVELVLSALTMSGFENTLRASNRSLTASAAASAGGLSRRR
jgi:hypothetical protein